MYFSNVRLDKFGLQKTYTYRQYYYAEFCGRYWKVDGGELRPDGLQWRMGLRDV